MTANPILLQKKYSRVIECFAKQQGLSLDAALDFFYHSQVYQLIREGRRLCVCPANTLAGRRGAYGVQDDGKVGHSSVRQGFAGRVRPRLRLAAARYRPRTLAQPSR